MGKGAGRGKGGGGKAALPRCLGWKDVLSDKPCDKPAKSAYSCCCEEEHQKQLKKFISQDKLQGLVTEYQGLIEDAADNPMCRPALDELRMAILKAVKGGMLNQKTSRVMKGAQLVAEVHSEIMDKADDVHNDPSAAATKGKMEELGKRKAELGKKRAADSGMKHLIESQADEWHETGVEVQHGGKRGKTDSAASLPATMEPIAGGSGITMHENPLAEGAEEYFQDELLDDADTAYEARLEGETKEPVPGGTQDMLDA